MPESVPTNEPEAHKRRSTRIVQAVPLTVTGVDALGRPFQERTSTLIINCHGSRYQSKHYVLKGMWVTLEVPHPEPGRPPRTVRGKVMWIQRPRTVRELFQVGIELEVSGNFWGIAFPPSDWFPFPEGLAAVPSPAPPPKPATVPAQASWPTAAVAVPAEDEDNVRTLPLPVVDQAAALKSSLAPQIAQLVEDAKQDLLASLRKSAAEAVSLEARPLIASLELQLRTIAESAMHAAAGAAAQNAFQKPSKVRSMLFSRNAIAAWRKASNASRSSSPRAWMNSKKSAMPLLSSGLKTAFTTAWSNCKNRPPKFGLPLPTTPQSPRPSKAARTGDTGRPGSGAAGALASRTGARQPGRIRERHAPFAGTVRRRFQLCTIRLGRSRGGGPGRSGHSLESAGRKLHRIRQATASRASGARHPVELGAHRERTLARAWVN